MSVMVASSTWMWVGEGLKSILGCTVLYLLLPLSLLLLPAIATASYCYCQPLLLLLVVIYDTPCTLIDT